MNWTPISTYGPGSPGYTGVPDRISVAMTFLNHIEGALAPKSGPFGGEPLPARPISSMEQQVRDAALMTILEYFRAADDASTVPNIPPPSNEEPPTEAPQPVVA